MPNQLLAVPCTTEWLFKMFKLVVCFLLVAIAAVSAGYVAYGPAHVGLGAYGAHGPFAISYSARVDTPRRVVAFAPASYGHYYHY